MSSAAVRARGLTKTFGDVIALDSVDLDVATGQIHGLVGPNGAGKSTLLGVLLRLAVADGGTLEMVDSVGGLVDSPGLYPTLTARRNLTALASLRGERANADELLARVGLSDVAAEPVRGFSLGMRQRLGLAAALVGNPRLLVLDEPANGLDPAGRRQVHRVLTDLTAAGGTVILSSHRMDDLAELCDEVTLLSMGRVVFSGPIQKLAAESGDLDYRVVTTNPVRAGTMAADLPGLRVVPGRDLVVRGPAAAVDGLVARLIGAGIAIRELRPVVPPLEAAYLSLTAEQVGPVTDGEVAS